MRPELTVAVLGTGTDVGKTWLGASVLGALRQTGAAVAARKPVQSFAPCEVETDAHVLAAASGEDPEQVCPRHRWYPAAMAPPMAAGFLGMASPRLDEVLAELWWPDPAVAVGLVETVGGPRSPVCDDADSATLAASLGADLHVLVAPAGLGALNSVLLCAPVVPEPLVVLLNRFDGGDLHDRNRRWLQAEGLDVVVSVTEVIRRLGPG